MLFLERAFYSLELSCELSLPWFPALPAPSLQLMDFARFFLLAPQSRNLLKAEGWCSRRDQDYFVLSQGITVPHCLVPQVFRSVVLCIVSIFLVVPCRKIQFLLLYFDPNQKPLIGFKKKATLYIPFKYKQM